jgi:hypothetical protein
MGSISVRPVEGWAAVDYVKDEVNAENLVDAVAVREYDRHVVFGAYRTAEYGVIGLVAFVQRDREGYINTKIMDEGMGPHHSARCPKRILDLLSPEPPPGHAAAWRARQGRTSPVPA